MENKKFNKTAIYSCICSIVCWFIFGWLGLVGMGLGIRALSEIKSTEEKGKILALVSIVLGTIGYVFYLKIVMFN